jgi:hypothetical protein
VSGIPRELNGVAIHLPEVALDETNNAQGKTETFTRDCDQLQAIVIDDTDLMVIGQLGPETDTDVLRDGDDFGCGDTLVFTFDHGPLFVDFAISTSIQQ